MKQTIKLLLFTLLSIEFLIACGSIDTSSTSQTLENSTPEVNNTTDENVTDTPVLQSKKLLTGVNLAGADFGYDTLPGNFGREYTYPTTEEVDYFMAKGMNIFRLPFLWERLQNDQSGPLNQDELTRIKDFVSYVTSKQGYVILDPHNGARYYNEIINLDGPYGALPLAAFEDFWTKLANQFKNNTLVIFGLMNEPHDMSS